MRKIIKAVFCLSLGLTLLSGCGKKEKQYLVPFVEDDFSNILFKFKDKKGEQEILLSSVVVNDVIDLSEDEFYKNHLNLNTPLETKYDYYTYHGSTYDNGAKFVFDHESIRTYLNNRFRGQKLQTEMKTIVNVFFTYTPDEYTIQYVGVDEDFSLKTYTVESDRNLPIPNIIDEHQNFEGWRIQGTDTIITRTPTENLSNLILEPYFTDKEYRIIYRLPIELDNPNPTSYTYFDEPINLIDFPNHPKGAYTFEGFYLNNEKITSIDPHLGKEIVIYCQFAFTTYTVNYYKAPYGFELLATYTFDYRTIDSVPVPEVPKAEKHYENGRWETTVTEFRNYDIRPVYDATIYKINYQYPFEGVVNNNITTFTAFDGVIDLIPLADSDKGYYTFDGFYLSGGKITSLDTSIGKDITIEARFKITKYEVKYYIGDSLWITDSFTFLTFKDYVQRDCPAKNNYHDQRWSELVTEIKNYTLYAQYTPDQYTVKVVTGVEGYTFNDTIVSYGEGVTYQDFADQLSYPDKYLLGLYLDNNFSVKLDLKTAVYQDITLYAKWGDIIHIQSANDWDKIVQDPTGWFILDNDISFKMESIPVINSFTGILDGQGHKIQRFSNSNTNCDATYGIFKTNNGTIKNLIIEDGSFVSTNTDGSSSCYLGVLCGKNNGTIENVDFVSVTANITANFYVTIDSFQDIKGYCFVGLCCGENQGTIKNCFIADDNQLTIKAKIGYYRTVGYSSTEYVMYGYFYYGLLVGINNGKVSNITSEGKMLINSISLKEEKKSWSYNLMSGGCRYLTRSGGIAGYNDYKGQITACVSDKVEITVDYTEPATETSFSGSNILGGIVGCNNGATEKCYTSSKTTLINKRNGDLEMGGIAGRQETDGRIKACYSDCSFSSTNSSGVIRIGGVIGYNYGSMSYCYATVSSAEISGSNKRGGGIGALVGYANDTSSNMFSLGIININNQIDILNCYDFGNATTNAILNKISIYAPEQTNTINCAGITSVNSLEALIQAAANYYFDEVDFTLYDNQLPTIEGIGKL